MCSSCTTIYKNIIEENQDVPSQSCSEDVVHQGLKGGWCVGETKWHNQKLVVTVMSLKRRFTDIFGSYSFLVVI